MPIVYTDKHRCEKCDRIFEWNHKEPLKTRLGTGLAPAEAFPVSLVFDNYFKPIGNNKYIVSAFCPHCRSENIFEFIP